MSAVKVTCPLCGEQINSKWDCDHCGGDIHHFDRLHELETALDETTADRDRLQESLDALQKVYQKSVDRTMDYRERVEELEQELSKLRSQIEGAATVSVRNNLKTLATFSHTNEFLEQVVIASNLQPGETRMFKLVEMPAQDGGSCNTTHPFPAVKIQRLWC